MCRIAIALAAVALLLAACGSNGDGDDAVASPTQQVLVGGPTEHAQVDASPDAADPSEDPTPSPEPRLVSLDWLAGEVAVPGLDGGIAAPTLDQGLQDAVAQALGGFTGHASIVIHNIADGRYAATNESEVHYAASTFKAAVLLEAYRQRDSGELDFDKQVKLEEKYTQDDLGTLEYLGLKTDDMVTVRDAVRGMIVVSDTPLALLMIDQLNSNRIDETLRSIGATTMTVNSRDLPTTALDLAQLMIAIVSGQGVTAESRDEMLSLMAQEWFAEGIIAGLPDGATYAHKSGNLGSATHDAAIVWGPGGPYVIVVMTDGSGGWSPIASVSSAVWQFFEAKP